MCDNLHTDPKTQDRTSALHIKIVTVGTLFDFESLTMPEMNRDR